MSSEPRQETYMIEIWDENSVKEFLLEKKNHRLVKEVLNLIKKAQIKTKKGDFLRVTLEFQDYHGYECFLTVDHFASAKRVNHEQVVWETTQV